MQWAHTPVLLQETLDLLSPQQGERILDVTLGLGGHAEAMLNAASNTALVGLDADQKNLAAARERLMSFGDRATLLHANFTELPLQDDDWIIPLWHKQFDCILADLGLSSPHIDDASRGFSFQEDGPLDMRFDSTSGMSAAELIDASTEEQIADVLYHFGEVRQSRKIAAVVKKQSPQTTNALRCCVEEACGRQAKGLLPQVFQALRIAVNDELSALQNLLSAVPSLLAPGGRCVVIAYHSLEDRLVKQTFREWTTPEIDPVTGAPTTESPFALLTRKPIKPSEVEIEQNSRARSARLRAVSKR